MVLMNTEAAELFATNKSLIFCNIKGRYRIFKRNLNNCKMTSALAKIKYKKYHSIHEELINEWKPAHEVWTLQYGDKILATVGAVNGMIINQMFRRKLRLRQQGIIITSIFTSLASGISSHIADKHFITNNIMQYKYSGFHCELKGVSLSLSTGFIQPLMLAPLINIMIAGNVGYRIPYVYEIREITKLWWAVIRPEFKILSLLLCFTTIVSGMVTNSKMAEMEKVVDTVLNFQSKNEEIIDEGSIYNSTTGKLVQ